jgi:hypothetical protein
VEFVAYDPTLGQIDLSFNEPVDIANFDYSEIVLQSSKENSSFLYNLLFPASVSYSDVRKMTITIILDQRDFENILLIKELASSISSTFISFGSSFISDTSGNNIVPVSGASLSIFGTIQESEVLSFSLDITRGVLNLTFSGVVDSSTLNPTFITFHDALVVDTESSFYTLSNESTTSSPSGFHLSIDLSNNDLNEIKKRRTLCINVNSTFIAVDSRALSDLSARLILPVRKETGLLQVAEYIGDTIRPELTSFSFALYPGIIHLTFSEMMDLTSFQVESISLQNSGNTAESLSLKDETIFPNGEGTTVIVTLTDESLNAIKYDSTFGTSKNTTFISFDSNLSKDMSSNTILPITSDNALRPQSSSQITWLLLWYNLVST